MKRFLVLISGFLVLGFYQMSGGADFDPVAAREAAVFARVQEDAVRRAAADPVLVASVVRSNKTARPAPAQISQTNSSGEVGIVTRAAVDLSILSATEAAAAPTPSGPAVLRSGENTAASPTAAGEPSIPESQTAKVIPSLIFPGTVSQASSVSITQERELRFVDGDLVNMRGGPGTGFDVVAQFQRNDAVEVLEEPGTGWIRLRSADGGPEGWIADFLLTDG